MSENVRPGTLPARERRAPQVSHQKIEASIKKLEILYDAVEGLDCVFLDRSKYRQLSIFCTKLQLNDDGTYAEPPKRSFFRPMSVEYFNAHPFDLDKNNGSYRYRNESSERVMVELMEHPSRLSQSINTATHLSYHLDWEFGSYPRKNMGCSVTHFAWNSVWHFSGYVFLKIRKSPSS